MKNYKRISAFLLAVMLCLSMVSVFAFAAEEGAATESAADEATSSATDTSAATESTTETQPSDGGETAEGDGGEMLVNGKVDPDAFTSSNSQAIPASYTKIAENNALALYIDYATGYFAVQNKADGVNWGSTPFDYENDKLANTATSGIAVSQLILTYVNASFSTAELRSTDAKIVTETFGESQIITFYFDDEGTNFAIPIMITLKEDYLEIELLIDSISEMSASRILSVSLLPVFGAGNARDDGYLLLPDGMGSLMQFNQHFTNVNVYTGAVYSGDPTSGASVSKYTYGRDLTEGVRLPVYGVKRGDSAYVAIMTQSESNATIQAYCSGMTNSYNYIFPTINMRDTQLRRTGVGNTGSGVYYSDSLPENFVMRFYFLSGADANYIGMAKTYRKYLVNEIGLQALAADTGAPMNVTLIGAYKRIKHFLGIPYTGVDTMTTFSQGSEILQALSDQGVDNMICNMIGWSNGGLEGAVSTSFNPESKLGGKSGAKALLEKASSLRIPMMFDVDLTNFYGSSGKYKRYNSTAYGLDRSPVAMFPFVLSLNRVDRTQEAHYLYHPTAMLSIAAEFVQSASNVGIADYSFMSIGNEPYAAYNRDDVSTRDRTTAKIHELFSNVAEQTDGIVSSSQGNAYIFPAVNNVTEAPLYSSQTYFAMTEVPFYHIALRGLVRLSGPALNLSSETEDVILRSAQYGVGLYAVFSHESSSNLKDTSYNNYYSTEFALLGDEIVDAYKRLKVVYDAVDVAAITDYQIVSDDLKITTFENGAVVYVNYSEKDITYNGVTIAARDFTVVGGDN